MSKFNPEAFDDCNVVSEEEQIFYDNPIQTFQENCLENVLYLCGWDKKNLAHLLKVSDSTVNNILANESMTNSKPTYLSRCQFISFLSIIQTKQVNKDHKVLIVFYLFSWFCSGLPGEMNIDKYMQLLSLESSELEKALFYKVVNNLCPELIHSFNLFMEWRLNSPDISMSEYYGGAQNENASSGWFNKQSKDTEEIAVKKVMKNINKFIPKYLEWYIEQITKWE